MTRERIRELLIEGKRPIQIRTIDPSVHSCVISQERGNLGIPKFKTRSQSRRVSEMITTARKMKIDGFTYRKIAETLGVTRQRAVQLLRVPGVRKGLCERCGAACEHRHHKSYVTDEAQFLCPSCHGIVEQNRDKLIDVVKSLAVNGVIDLKSAAAHLGLSYQKVLKLSKFAGVRTTRGLHPRWLHVNWDLPNTVLAEIWDIDDQHFSDHRRRLKLPRAKFWNLLLPHWKSKPDTSAMDAAIEEEKKKVVVS